MEICKQDVAGSSPVSSTINLGLKCHLPRYDVIKNKPLYTNKYAYQLFLLHFIGVENLL
jgi:hypothetical protein